MKRNIHDMRWVLLEVEEGARTVHGDMAVATAVMLHDGGFVHGHIERDLSGNYDIELRGLTAAGADLLDDLRSEAFVNEARRVAEAIGVDRENLWFIRRYVRARMLPGAIAGALAGEEAEDDA